MAWSLTVLSFVLTAVTGYVFVVKTPEVTLMLTQLLEWAAGLLTSLVTGGVKQLGNFLPC